MYPSEMEEKPFNPTNLHKDTMEAILLKKGVCVGQHPWPGPTKCQEPVNRNDPKSSLRDPWTGNHRTKQKCYNSGVRGA